MIGSHIRLPDQLHQSRAHLEPHIGAFAPALADDRADATPPLWRAPGASALDVASALAIAAVMCSSVNSLLDIAESVTRGLVNKHDASPVAPRADGGLATIRLHVATPLADGAVKRWHYSVLRIPSSPIGKRLPPDQ